MSELILQQIHFDYIIPVDTSLVKYSSSCQVLEIKLNTPKKGEVLTYKTPMTPEHFGQVCSYFGMNSNNADLFRMLERLKIMGKYTPFLKGVPLSEQEARLLERDNYYPEA